MRVSLLLSTSRPNDEGGMSLGEYGRAMGKADMELRARYQKVKKEFDDSEFNTVKVELRNNRTGLDLLISGEIYFTKDGKRHRLGISHLRDDLDLYLNGSFIDSRKFDNYIDSLERKQPVVYVMGKILANRYVLKIVHAEDMAKNLRELIKVIKMFDWTTRN